MYKKDMDEDYDYLAHARAATEMTGMIPAGVNTEEEAENYDDLFPYPPPVVKKQVEDVH